MATDTVRTVIVGSSAGELRRRLGPTSWVVLEELLQRSTDGEARVSIRTLAVSLGLAKDTVARAVRRLGDAGLIVAHQTRSEAGVFDTGSYRLAVPASCLAVLSKSSAASSSPRSSSARRSSSGQLALSLEV